MAHRRVDRPGPVLRVWWVGSACDTSMSWSEAINSLPSKYRRDLLNTGSTSVTNQSTSAQNLGTPASMLATALARAHQPKSLSRIQHLPLAGRGAQRGSR